MNFAARRPMPIPNGHAPVMEKNSSQSPVDLPTPPDDVTLSENASIVRNGIMYGTRKNPLLYTPAYRAELPRYTPMSYPNTRSYGVGLSSAFQLSAERQNVSPAATEDTSFDNDMSVDDVFAVSNKADHRRSRATHVQGLGIDDVSPGLVPLLENDDVVPSIDQSMARSMPDSLALSPSSRRSSSLVRTPSTSSRRVPYNVPSRSPGSLNGPLSQAYAMSMKPSSSSRSMRRPSWSPYSRPLMITRMGTSMPATSYAMYSTYDDDETDDEMTGVDDDGTDDETDMIPASKFRQNTRLFGQPTMHSSSSSLARSLPISHVPSFLPRSAPDDTSRSQVHMAAAALDRLSMTSTSYDDDKQRALRMPTVDETDQVAAIRDRLGGAANCSAFISKLWHLMINPDLYGKYIYWSEAGDAIIINSEPDVAAEFAAEILPKLFKHGNNASFVRQLNLYGFQRVSSSRLLDAAEMRAVAARTGTSGHYGTSAPFNTAMELYGVHSSFAHPRFRRGQEAWLVSMKPRSSKKPKKNSAGPTDETKSQSSLS